MTGVAIAGTVQLGASVLRYRLDVAPGEHLTVIGPNGAGKTALLKTIAGLLRLSEGRLTAGEQVLDEPARGVFVVPPDRPVTLQPQTGALFPHLSVLDNVAFPLRLRGARRFEARARARELLEGLAIDSLADRRPAGLSGGEAARVALGRSLAADPAVLLLDEPAAALDVAARAQLRHHLVGLDRTLLTVTHDPVEARLLGRRMAVVHEGRVAQVGTAEEIAARPASPWVATLLGLNIVSGTARGREVALASGATVRLAERADGPVNLTFPDNAVTLHDVEPHSSARNVWAIAVTGLHAEGDRVRVAFVGPMEGAAVVTTAAADELGLRPGSNCWASVKATELTVLPG